MPSSPYQNTEKDNATNWFVVFLVFVILVGLGVGGYFAYKHFTSNSSSGGGPSNTNTDSSSMNSDGSSKTDTNGSSNSITNTPSSSSTITILPQSPSQPPSSSPSSPPTSQPPSSPPPPPPSSQPPSSPSPPPPPPSSPSEEVFGVQFNFNELYDTDITIQPEGTIKYKDNFIDTTVISNRLNAGYTIATMTQLRQDCTAGMQCYKWGLCMADDNVNLAGAFPTQTCIDPSTCTSSTSTSPRVVTVVSPLSGQSLPNVIWIYGFKPLESMIKKDPTSFQLFVSDIGKTREVYPWMTPFLNITSNSLFKKYWSMNDDGARTTCGDSLTNCAINIVATGGANISPGCCPGYIIDSYIDYEKNGSGTVPPKSKPPTLGNPSIAWVTSAASSLNLKFRFTPDGYIVSQQKDGSVYALSVLSAFDQCPVQLVYFDSISNIQEQPIDTSVKDPSTVKVTGATKFLFTNEGHLILKNNFTYGVCWGNPPYAGVSLWYGGLHVRALKNLFTTFFM